MIVCRMESHLLSLSGPFQCTRVATRALTRHGEKHHFQLSLFNAFHILFLTLGSGFKIFCMCTYHLSVCAICLCFFSSIMYEYDSFRLPPVTILIGQGKNT